MNFEFNDTYRKIKYNGYRNKILKGRMNDKMLSIEQIKDAVSEAAVTYRLKNVWLFGSYANGCANEKSDVDIMVEFIENPVSLLKFFGFQQELSEKLGVPVDVIKYPISEDATRNLELKQVIHLYSKVDSAANKILDENLEAFRILAE